MVTIGRREGGEGRGGTVGCAAGARRGDRGYCRCRWDGMLMEQIGIVRDRERDTPRCVEEKGTSATMSGDDGSRKSILILPIRWKRGS